MWKSVKKCLHKWIKCKTTSKFNFVLTWQRCWHYEYRTHSHSGSGCCWADNMDRLQFPLLVKYKLFDWGTPVDRHTPVKTLPFRRNAYAGSKKYTGIPLHQLIVKGTDNCKFLWAINRHSQSSPHSMSHAQRKGSASNTKKSPVHGWNVSINFWRHNSPEDEQHSSLCT